MASLIGSGAPFVASWREPSEAASPSIVLAPKPPPEPPPLDPAVEALLERIGSVLSVHRDGLSLVELREALAIGTDALRPALEGGLRLKVLRRTGSHSTLRYLTNVAR